MFVFVKQALRGIAAERRRQAAIRELSKLSDHLLLDIGLRRDELATFMLEISSESPEAPEPIPALQQGLAYCG